VRYDVGHKELARLLVVWSIRVDQHVDTGILVLPDQVYGLSHGTDKAAQRPAGSQALALRGQRSGVRASTQGWIRVFSIVS